MLESGVDRIITQVVDPKMNHTFRPQIETAIHDFLSGDRKEENSLGCTPGPPEPTETQEPPSASGPKTPWGFVFKPDIQLKATGNLEILRSVFSRCRKIFLAVYTALHTFSMAQHDVTRTNEKDIESLYNNWKSQESGQETWLRELMNEARWFSGFAIVKRNL